MRDEESGLFENHNRYYAPDVGRYLQPEPLLLEPRTQLMYAREGLPPSTYSYARSNPVFRFDETGLYDVDKNCKFVAKEKDAIPEAMKITDVCLRDCVMRKMGAAKISCDLEAITACTADKKMAGGTPTGGQCKLTPWWDLSTPNVTKVLWCNKKLKPACQAKAIVHELAHLCGWNEGDGKGVPFDSGTADTACL